MTAETMAEAWDLLQREAVAIIDDAARVDVTLRVVGSAGIRLHCGAAGPLMDRLGRPAKDIDFIVPQRHRKGMRRVLESRGYVVDRDLLIAMEGRRYSFAHRDHGTEIDVFVEKLDFCHTIELSGRLARHPVTIPIEELLLQKLQIVQMTTTDMIDAGVLLATHEVSDTDDSRTPVSLADTPVGEPGQAPEQETIDAGHIARLLARDWGFHHTATRNLQRVREQLAPTGAADVGAERNLRAQDRVRRLLTAIETEPKTLAWRMRDKVGERKQWWQDVDDREATY
jgi:hypothetical protein